MKKNYKEILLGSVIKGKIEINAESLSILEHEDSVVSVFCSYCGNTFEVTQSGADAMLFRAGVKTDNFKGKYLENSSCFVCRVEDPDKIKVYLKQIPLA